MSIGAGITLIVVGLILLLGVVEVDIPWINEYALGMLLTLAGVVSIVLVLAVGNRPWSTYVRRGGGTRVVERRIERDVHDPNVL